MFKSFVYKSIGLGMGLALALDGTKAAAMPSRDVKPSSRFSYSEAGREHEVSFDGVYRVRGFSVHSFDEMSEFQKEQFIEYRMKPVMAYVFGPLTYRSIGGPKEITGLRVDWASAREAGSVVEIPYTYQGRWLIDRRDAEKSLLEVPVPFNDDDVFSPGWKKCTDRDPEHQTRSFYWYFWDPRRPGCDHQEGKQYFTAQVRIGDAIAGTVDSYPEYQRLIRDTAEGRELRMTIGFGYVVDRSVANPDRDGNMGMREYQEYLESFRAQYGSEFTEEPILQGEYKASMTRSKIIGHRFRGERQGVRVILNVVTSTNIDQMDLFAKSFAHDHDGVFAWFGHSRVGSGFDAERFEFVLRNDPEYYSLTDQYQLIYWGGCNSYSYYTLPFFALKSSLNPEADPNGIRNLDIIANGLPSFFALNSTNAMILTRHILNWQERPSYQMIIRDIERAATRFGARVLAIVLGDEDNPQ